MSRPSIEVIRADNVLGEGPQWSAARQELFWIDGSKPHIWRWRWGAASPEAWPLQRPPAAVLPLDDGRLVIAFRTRMVLADRFGGALRPLELPGLDLGDERFNDAKVDSRGRLWIGTIDREFRRPLGRLYRIDDDTIAPVDGGFAQSNGIAWAPDASVLYFAESFERVVHRYAFDATTGSVRRLDPLLRVQGPPAKPDGVTVDAEGGVWCAVFGGGRVERRTPDGSLDRAVALPVDNPTSCMFGGPDLRTLFVTTATYGVPPAELPRQALAGSVLALDAGVQGLAEPTLAPTNLLFSKSIVSSNHPESTHA